MEYGIISGHFGFSLVFLLLLRCNDIAGQGGHHWETGPWGACENERCGFGGTQYREVWCQSDRGHPVHYSYCGSLHKPSEFETCYKDCNAESVILDKNYGERDSWSQAVDVVWSVSPWSTCKLSPGSKVCGKYNGVQTRKVICERRDSHIKVEEHLCQVHERKPNRTQPCELLCKQDCIVSLYSSWSKCDSTCRIPNRSKTRRIIVPPRHGGKHCQAFSMMLPCENCTESYSYSLEPWEPCQPFENTFRENVKTHPLIGYQKRVINCLASRGTITKLKFCTDKVTEPLLHQHQSCIIPQDCVVSGWSQIEPFNNSCFGENGINSGYMIRTLSVLQLPLGNGRPCPDRLHDVIKVDVDDVNNLKPCRRAKWIVSGWNTCEPVPGYSHCGIGIQSRKAICVEVDEEGLERPVSDVRCDTDKRPLISQRCHVECNWHCSVSQWTAWSQCEDRSCDDNGKKRQLPDITGKRYRTREILTLPGPGGNPCPHLSETQSCVPKACFYWNTTLGDCEPSQRGGCGVGHRTRHSVCSDRSGERVSESLCWEHERRTEDWEDCYVPCWNDCVLSEWGDWTRCPEPCTGSVPTTRKRGRRILAFSGKDGQPCAPLLKEEEPCPALVECAKYRWKHGDWGKCLLEKATQICGRGIQQRDVQCYNHLGQTVLERRCEDRVKPKQSQTCTVECPKDCLVTEWAEWSSCGVECLNIRARQILPKQQRQRYILQFPEGSGTPCPNSLFEERQCLHLPICEQYEWETSNWSSCILPPVVPYCGNGLRARNISCQHGNGTKHPTNTCLWEIGAMPPIVEKCYVACAKECHISDWSSWERCVGGCNGFRFRTRKLLGESRFNPVCRHKYQLDEQEKCKCSQLSPMVIGGWSDCILDEKDDVKQRFAQMSLKSIRHRDANESMRSDPTQAYCGSGKQFKAYACQNDRRDMESADKCFNSEYKEEVCIVPCPVDCEMTEWSDWSQCSVTCGSGMQLRFRSIATQPADGGRKCPSLDGTRKETQSRVCRSPCEYHVWEGSKWGSCRPMTGTGCGHGTQSRGVRCKTIGETRLAGTFPDDSLCNQHERLEENQVCLLPCPGDCVFSDWTAWTACTQPCNGRQTQRRSRNLLRKPASYFIKSHNNCTHMVEQQPCVRGDNCIEYSWQLSEWTSCLVNSGHDECGVGHKERYAWCRDERGRTVDSIYCTKIQGEVTESMVVSCEIPCDNDCLLSDWSDWTPCTTKCGLGVTQRNRTVIENPLGNGRRCPPETELRQSKPCFKKGCYRWIISDWSECQAETGVCGESIQTRNVSCVGEDGLAVETNKCPVDVAKLVMKTVQTCHVSCPGECLLSKWSQWSECHISCQDFSHDSTQNIGVKVRSRAILAHPRQDNVPCSELLWEEEPCHAQRCYSFYWFNTKWNRYGKREVWCQRSDGLHVMGACDERLEPPQVLKCQPPCLADKSECSDTNVCRCRGELEALYHPDGTIELCVMDKNQTTTILTTSVTLPADGASNIWMYAVIAVGTIFVISVAAALYNMCELFRTGPRPRRRDGKSSQNDIRGSQNMNEKNAEMDALYKQCNQSTNDLNKDLEKVPDHMQNVRLLHGITADERPSRSACPHVSQRFYACLFCPKNHENSENELNQANLTNESTELTIRSACLSNRELDLDLPSPVLYSNIGELQFHSSMLEDIDRHNVPSRSSVDRWNEDNSLTSHFEHDSYACSLNTTQSFDRETNKSSDSKLFGDDIRRDPSLVKMQSQDSNDEAVLSLYALPHKSRVAVHSPEDNQELGGSTLEPTTHLWHKTLRPVKPSYGARTRDEPSLDKRSSHGGPPPPVPPRQYSERSSPNGSAERLDVHSLSAGNICDMDRNSRRGAAQRSFWSPQIKNDRTHPLDTRESHSVKTIPVLKVNGEITVDKKETTV
ncbi:thrombospondin type-1 domain-containing protein 7A-like isoform X1 [Haliotis rufescens]|uniref:thrombospondin type-1 domain-containing protein 7A-like isoform X1 n=1 Tax=Haliotis rufescens TaxID=6454 RepID=UPI00201EC007|nr:thrombospondin type-1 domain-containing protein 7A-like isoform X1 [Haliotis rufescens]XP_048238541.1 thrombospondin type-1 domain-containing protein 7A-like isoform X1 [Haliotis rufescens]XP_048238542.1 thrombospondin type-1 domain-containing protein 7A-like isoform X1 [Haliotis rufescens]